MARPQLPVDQISKAAVRKRAQRATPLAGATCSRCGSPTCLERHHADYSKPTDTEILCRQCHRKEDEAAGTWVPDRVKPSTCKVCRTEFQPKRSRRAILCGSPNCLAANGKVSAEKRWQAATTDSGKGATALSHCALRSHLSSLLGDQE